MNLTGTYKFAYNFRGVRDPFQSLKLMPRIQVLAQALHPFSPRRTRPRLGAFWLLLVPRASAFPRVGGVGGPGTCISRCLRLRRQKTSQAKSPLSCRSWSSEASGTEENGRRTPEAPAAGQAGAEGGEERGAPGNSARQQLAGSVAAGASTPPGAPRKSLFRLCLAAPPTPARSL